MNGQNCASTAAAKNGAATDQDIVELRRAAPSIVAEMVRSGKEMSLTEFVNTITSKDQKYYDPRYEQFAPHLWLEGVDAYNANRPAGAPEIKPKLTDFMPDFQSIHKYAEGDEEGMSAAAAQSINNSMRRAASYGLLSKTRGVNEGAEHGDMGAEQAAAERLLRAELDKPGGPVLSRADLYKKAGVTPTQAVHYYRVLRENMGAAITDMGKELLKAQHRVEVLTSENAPLGERQVAEGKAASLEVQQLQMFNMLDYVTAQAGGNASHIGRALRALRDTSRLLRTGSAKADLFNKMFPDGKTTGLTDGGLFYASRDRTKVDAMAERAAQGQPTAQEAWEKNMTSPESPTAKAGLNKDTAFTKAEQIDGVAKRFALEWAGDGKLTAHEEAMLTEIGMHSFALHPDAGYEAWCKHVQSITGRKLPPERLLDIYQSMRRAFFKTLRDEKGVLRKGIDMAKGTIFGEAREKAIKELRAVDLSDTSAEGKAQQRKEMEEILRKYQKDTPVMWLAELGGLKRAFRTAFDQSAPLRQAAHITLGWGLNPQSFIGDIALGMHDKGVLDLDPNVRKSFTDARQRRKIVGNAMLDMMMAKNDRFHSFMKKFRDTGAASSEEFAANIMEDILSRPHSDLYGEYGLGLTRIGDTLDLNSREEAYQSLVFERLRNSPNVAARILGEGVHSSERAYATYLNLIRANAFDHLATVYAADGYTPFNSPELYRDTAKMINDMTGRSDVPFDKNNSSASLLSKVYFSARFQASVVKRIMMPGRALASAARQSAERSGTDMRQWEKSANEWGHFTDMHPAMQREVLGNTARLMSAYAAIAGLAYQMGASIDLDPRSADYLKLRFGNTRLSILGGTENWIRFLARIGTGERLDTLRTVKTSGGNLGTRAVWHQFWDSKAAPVVSDLQSIAFGDDAMGNDVMPSLKFPYPRNEKELKKMLLDLFYNNTPMHLKEIADGGTQGGPIGAALSLLSYFGVGVSTYDDKKPRERLKPFNRPSMKPLPVLAKPKQITKPAQPIVPNGFTPGS